MCVYVCVCKTGGESSPEGKVLLESVWCAVLCRRGRYLPQFCVNLSYTGLMSCGCAIMGFT